MYSNKLKYPLTFIIALSPLPNKIASYNLLTCFRCYGPKRPSAELSWKSRLFVWHDTGFFSLLYTQKLDNLSFHSVYILVNLYSSISFEVQLWSHLPWTSSSAAGTFLYGTAHIEQLHANNYIRIYDYTCNTKTFQTIKEMVSRNLHIIINHFMHRSLLTFLCLINNVIFL